MISVFQRMYPLLNFPSSRFLHVTLLNPAGGKWREQHGLSRTGTSYGPLTDCADWSYVDGRPAPLTSRRREKREARKLHLSRRVVRLLKEVDVAKYLAEEKAKQERIAKEREQNYYS